MRSLCIKNRPPNTRESLWIPIDGSKVKIKSSQKYSKIKVNHPLSHLNLDMKIKTFEIDKNMILTLI